MKVALVGANGTVACEPLTVTRSIGECRVGSQTFKDLQSGEFLQAGLSLSEATDAELFVPANVWLEWSDLRRLAKSNEKTSMVDPEGRVLAWKGESSSPKDCVANLSVEGKAFCIRYPWDFLALQEFTNSRLDESVIKGDLSPAAHVEGILLLGEGSRILPGVFIEGHVVIGSHCKIGPNAYIRGCTSIGDHCHIGQSVEIKNSIIYSHTAIGHLSYCGDSIIGEGVNFGAGTITSNLRHDGKNHRSMIADTLIDTGRRKFGVIIGDGVHTGIHTSLYPGRKLWPKTSTLPGEIVQRDVVN